MDKIEKFLEHLKLDLNYSDKTIDIINSKGEDISLSKWNYYVDKEV